jgi:hypothetical protein
MVPRDVREALATLGDDELAEVREYIDEILLPAVELTEEQKATIRRRGADMAEDPSIGVSWRMAYAGARAEHDKRRIA